MGHDCPDLAGGGEYESRPLRDPNIGGFTMHSPSYERRSGAGVSIRPRSFGICAKLARRDGCEFDCSRLTRGVADAGHSMKSSLHAS